MKLEALHGGLYLRHPLFPETRCGEAIELARAFFALSLPEKRRLGIENSPHFRGYSEMRNERDWREQIHFGREEASAHGAAHQQLRGPNLWAPIPDWRERMLALMADLELAGRDALDVLARQAGLSGKDLLPADEAPYLLLKLIHYLEPPSPEARSGVAPHVDFSWITLILQDTAGGLQALSPGGGWRDVPHVPGTLVLQIGEILQSASRNHFPATPHRVVNRPGAGSRISLPFFLNPALDRWIAPAEGLAESPFPNDPEHVHRVFTEPRREPFCFGGEEWKRKGLGVWCASCVSASTYA
ncbi:MAG: 2OG-Fe(II) oxygenase family protein [Bryobacteraceae bacterium]